MKYDEVINPIEGEYDLPYGTVESTWRFFRDNSIWVFRSAIIGRPIAIRYRDASNRRSMIDHICLLRLRFCERYPQYDGKIKIVGSIPYVLVVMLKDSEVPESPDKIAAPMDIFWEHHRNFSGSGTHPDPSRPAPEEDDAQRGR